jgi:hypothetical protein
MNLRKVTLRYLGWCPGVESAARFIPEGELSSKTVLAMAISFTSIIIVGLYIAQNLLAPPTSGPLEIKIDGVKYTDEDFDEDFNYPGLRDSYIDFTIRRNASEFTASGDMESQILEFEKLEDTWLLLEELDTPSVVIGFARWLSNRTFNEAYQEFYGRDPMEIKDYPSTPEVSLTLGSRMAQRCRFQVDRHPSSLGGVDIYVNGTDGIFVIKRETGIGRGLAVWSLYIRLNDTPPYPAVFSRYPYPER